MTLESGALESGRKLGIISSLIMLILPLVSLFTVLTLLFSQLWTLPRTSPSPILTPALIAAFCVLAIISFSGVVLFLLAMRRLAWFYQEPAIYKNTLYGFSLSVAAAVAGIIFQVAYYIFGIGQLPVGTPVTFSAILQLMVGFLAFFLVVFVLGILTSLFYMRAFNALGDKSGLGNFRTAGLLLLTGTVLTVVLVGAVVVWVAWIFAVMGFFALKNVPAQAYPSATPQPSTVTPEQARYCPYCGTRNSLNARFCQQCGKQLA